MADNLTVDVVRSHQDDQDSIASATEKHGDAKSRSQVPAEVDPDDKYKRDVPPDGGYGWVCVACVFWINAHTWGINSVSGHSSPRKDLH